MHACDCGVDPGLSLILARRGDGHALTLPRPPCPSTPRLPVFLPHQRIATMVSLHGSADVLSANPPLLNKSGPAGALISLYAQDASSCISTVRGLLAVPDTSREEGPSAKRRKVGGGGAVPIQSQAKFDETRSIVLAKVSIDLVSIHGSHCGIWLTFF